MPSFDTSVENSQKFHLTGTHKILNWELRLICTLTGMSGLWGGNNCWGISLQASHILKTRSLWVCVWLCRRQLNNLAHYGVWSLTHWSLQLQPCIWQTAWSQNGPEIFWRTPYQSRHVTISWLVHIVIWILCCLCRKGLGIFIELSWESVAGEHSLYWWIFSLYCWFKRCVWAGAAEIAVIWL